MLETSARLLRLLSLLQMRRDWPGPELARRLQVDPRTVRRDVERLRGLGYPVHSVPGAAGGYRLGSGAHLPPLLLDDEEAVAVALGLRTAASGSIAGIEESSVRALAKLEQMLPAQLRQRVNALQAFTVPLISPASASAIDASQLTAIASACRDCARIRFPYRDREGSTGIRTVEPHRLVYTGRRWYLMAWDVDRQDWRTFRVDRTEALLSSGPRFVPRDPPEDAATYVSRSISAEPYRYQARVTLHAPAEVAAMKASPAAALIQPIGAETCSFQSGADSLDALALFVVMFGVDFEVHEPPELVEHMHRLAQRLARVG